METTNIPQRTHDILERDGFKYPPVFAPFLSSAIKYQVLVGGAGSGKSRTAAQKLVARMQVEPGARFLVVRKFATNLRKSVFQLFTDILAELDNREDFKVLLTERRIEYKPNGALALFIGIDNPEKIKSIQGISSVWIEEATELNEDDFRQLELRVRGETPGYKQFTITCNPISDENWVYTCFCTPEISRKGVQVLYSTAWDNPFIDADYLDMLTSSVADDEAQYRIYTQGRWGAPSRKGLFYKKFDSRRHVAEKKAPEPEKPLCLSFDFNVLPYLTCTVWQIEGLQANQVDEVCLEGPRNTPEDMAAELLIRYGPHWPGGVRLYGDPSGKASDSGRRQNLFDQLMDGLAPLEPELRVARKAPALSTRGRWINRILATEYDGISIRIGQNCRTTLKDYSQVREDADGGKTKPKICDRETKQAYEPYGHCSDANDYLLCAVFAESFINFERRGGRAKSALPDPRSLLGG